jgi:2-oxo-4-hydroxy-4-carboxy--5-ureidoimidazoline (OHCU) decarboxylase
MTRTWIEAVAGVVVVAGALFVAGTTWVSAQTPPTPWAGMHGAMGGMQGHGTMAGSADHAAMMAQHPEMSATVAKALGLTTEELQAQINAGKTVPQIAQEKGINLDTLRTTMMAQHQADGTHPGMGRFQGGNN